MDQEIYLDRDTFFHRLDPRTKIFILMTVFVVVLYFEHPLWVLPMTILILLQGYFSKSLSNLRRIRLILIILTISSLILWTLFSRGQTRIFGPITQEGLLFAFNRILVMTSLIIEGMIFLSTTRTEEFVLGMIRLGLPYRVGFAISTALRMVPTIFSSVGIISQAQRSRGLDLDSGGLIERMRKYVPLLVPVFISTIRGTNVFGMALESKGFGARPKRTFFLNPRFQNNDFLVIAILVIIFVIATYCKIAGYGSIPGLTRF
ncbi:MAG: energy-coupling factor transporter transmembrane protein EcfT [Chloroflexi bacterium]|nr:MAG: energy-coupling factor transporter transmembrane protein EcfT [Chloroflexota bacterium]